MRAVRLVVAAAVAALAVAGSAHAGSLVGAGTAVDTGADYNGGKALPFAPGTRATARAAARAVHGTASVAAVGDERMWFAADDVLGTIYLKNYTLRAIGDHIEVWVASDSDEVSTGTQFPAGDCRNDSVEVKDEQIQALIREFEQQNPAGRERSVQRRSRQRRQPRADRGRRASRRLLGRGGRQRRRARRQRPRRQLLRPERSDRVRVHPRLLLLGLQRARRPQRDDGGRVRLAPSPRRQPAPRTVPGRSVPPPAGDTAPLRGDVRARVPAPARTTTPTPTRRRG